MPWRKMAMHARPERRTREGNLRIPHDAINGLVVTLYAALRNTPTESPVAGSLVQPGDNVKPALVALEEVNHVLVGSLGCSVH
jgi:hypothetical protein